MVLVVPVELSLAVLPLDELLSVEAVLSDDEEVLPVDEELPDEELLDEELSADDEPLPDEEELDELVPVSSALASGVARIIG